MLRGKEGSKMTSLPKVSWLDQGQLERLVRLEKLPAFKGLSVTVQSSEVGILMVVDIAACIIKIFSKTSPSCFKLIC
jgi:hypothetical protein